MAKSHCFAVRTISSSLIAAMLITGCGGGGGGDSAAPAASAPVSSQLSLSQEPNAPQLTGNTSTDGFNWINFRRQQLGVPSLSRNSLIDVAAQGHSDYQKLNATITHDQTAGNPGFTGVTLTDRLKAAGYVFNQNRYAYGEVISASGVTSGFEAADGLISAIYHRFVMFEPMFKEAGAGAGSVSGGYTYFTTDFAANGLGTGLGQGNFVTYPVANQERVPTIFYSDSETPDPVPGQNEVGYPVSIHADITAVVNVQSFTLQPRGGAALSVRLLTRALDDKTLPSAAAIVPLSVLKAGTTYDAQFVGTVNGVAANRSWSFTTK